MTDLGPQVGHRRGMPNDAVDGMVNGPGLWASHDPHSLSICQGLCVSEGPYYGPRGQYVWPHYRGTRWPRQAEAQGMRAVRRSGPRGMVFAGAQIRTSS